jgi:hypothetical protein
MNIKQLEQLPFEDRMPKEVVRENINENFAQLFQAAKFAQSDIENIKENAVGLQAKLTPGRNITIEDDVISASEGSGLIVELLD